MRCRRSCAVASPSPCRERCCSTSAKPGGNRNSRLRILGPLAYLAITALFNVFPLPRSSGFRRSFAHAGEALDHGYSVLIFPEGHRSEDGQLHAFRPGIGLLAMQSRVPILARRASRPGELKREKSRWFRSGKLTDPCWERGSLRREAPSQRELTRAFRAKIRELG